MHLSVLSKFISNCTLFTLFLHLNAIGLEMHLTPPFCFGALQFAFPENFSLVDKMYNSIAAAKGLIMNYSPLTGTQIRTSISNTTKNISCKVTLEQPVYLTVLLLLLLSSVRAKFPKLCDVQITEYCHLHCHDHR